MSIAQNKANVRRLFEEFQNPKTAEELLHPDYVNYDFPAPAPGREGWQMVTAMFRAGFPDMQVVVEDEIAEGNKVVSRGKFTGTHRGDFMGIPPTGRSISVKYIDIWTVQDGKLKENWVQMDMMGLMQQLGVVPTPNP